LATYTVAIVTLTTTWWVSVIAKFLPSSLRAKPDGRPRLEGVRYENTRQAADFLHIPPSPYTSCIH